MSCSFVSSVPLKHFDFNMLPPNLLIVSMVIFLTTTVSTAPVEEKEQEEVEVEALEEGEGELSEEEEDDDESQSQDKLEGVLGVQQTTTAAAAASGGSGAAAGVSSNIQDLSASSSQSAGGGTHDGTAGSSTGHTGDSSSKDSAAAGGQSSSAGSQPSGNGQKLLNGGGGGGATGVSVPFGGGVSNLDYTGPLDSSSHDFLLSLMGGGDPFTPAVHTNIPDHMTRPTQLDFTGVTAAPSADLNSGSSLDSLSDPAHHSDISIDQSGADYTSLISGPNQSQHSSLHESGSSHSADPGDSAASSSSSHQNTEHTGNGRQTLLTETNPGGAESVTGLNIDLTASGLGHDVTESSPVILHTETHTLTAVSGVFSNTDLVTVVSDLTGTDTVSADPTGTPLHASLPAVTERTAGSVTEQYNTSGQGPEGAENVELEDTC